MKCGCFSGSSLITSVAAAVGIVGLGIGGFNMIRTGCPLGSCGESVAASCCPNADSASVSAKSDSTCSGCPLGAEESNRTALEKTTKETPEKPGATSETAVPTSARQPG